MQQDKATGAVSHNVANAAHETRAVVTVLDDVTHAANTTRGVADTVLAASEAVDTAAVKLRQRIKASCKACRCKTRPSERSFPFVPAKAGTHTPCAFDVDLRTIESSVGMGPRLRADDSRESCVPLELTTSNKR